MSDEARLQLRIRLEAALRDDRSRAIEAHGANAWDVADVMAIVWPEIDPLIHHYEIVLDNAAHRLEREAQALRAQIAGEHNGN